MKSLTIEVSRNNITLIREDWRHWRRSVLRT